MAVSPADVRVIVERICARPEVLDACARRDLGAVIAALKSSGITQGQISALTGIPQGRLSEYATGKRKPQASSTFEAFADGVGLPTAARHALGLAQATASANAAGAPEDGIRPSYPDGVSDAVDNVSALWRWTWPIRPRFSAAGPTRARGVTPHCGGSSIQVACRTSSPKAV